MDLSVVEPLLRLALTLEFALLAVAGAAAAVYCVSLDAELRKLAREQQEILNGVRDAIEARRAEKERRTRASIEALRQSLA